MAAAFGQLASTLGVPNLFSPVAFRLVFLAASLALSACSTSNSSPTLPPTPIDQTSYGRLMKLADDVDQRGDHGTAATLYLRATQEPGAGIEAWNRLGELKLVSRDAVGAERAFQQALALDPDNPHSQLGLGTAQLRLGYAERAQPLLASAAPRLNSVAAFTRLGVAEALLGHTASAQDAFFSAKTLAPNDLDTRCNLALAYILNDQPGLALDEINGADTAPAAQPRHQRNALLVQVLVGRQGNPAEVRLDGIDAPQRQALIDDAKRIAAIKDPATRAQAMGLVERH
ncbi:hypothetical protein EA797_10005 [Stutzerimonas zhaodongensis]|uniref:Tetratricopeptide repeat protein n=1 Tax=Stutzerimonas zhaodongensis TaxID=1176257 RepID=A0A3M2HND1_9GAMM|nr:hypothetical protein EA797_10005 [Stutzerimonas zhaodongensis]